MSDAQLPPEIDDGEDNPSLRSGAHLDHADVKSGDTAGDDAPQKPLVSVPDPETEWENNETAPAAPAPAGHTPVLETVSGDSQASFDLRLPGAVLQVALPSGALSFPSEVTDTHTVDLEPLGAPDADAHGRDTPDIGNTSTAADTPMEISPIFSALDAAESASPRLDRSDPDPEPYALDGVTVPPRPQPGDREDETVAPYSAPRAPETPVFDRAAIDAHHDDGVMIEAVALPDAAPGSIATRYTEEQSLPAEAVQDAAAARIAAEASATAAALENLKRLLGHKFPEPGLAMAQNREDASLERTEPPPIPAYRHPVQLPITPPPMVAAPVAATALTFADYDDTPPRRRVAVGSFFAGFVLSWVVGAVLYMFLSAG